MVAQEGGGVLYVSTRDGASFVSSVPLSAECLKSPLWIPVVVVLLKEGPKG